MRRRFLWLLVLLPLLAALTLVVFLLSSRPGRRVGSELKPDSGPVNVLVIGLDARALGPVKNEGRQRNPREKQSHSDIVILAHVNLERGQVNLFALPRDLLVQVPGLTSSASPTDFNRMEKLAHVHAIGGAKLLRRTLEGLLGITIHRHVAFDFDSFRMVFGLFRPFLGNLAVAGRRLTDRQNALQFVRQRNGLHEDDLDRCRNSLRLITEVTSRTWWLADRKLGEILIKRALSVLGPDTDMTEEEVSEIVAGLRQSGFKPSRIRTAVLVGEGADVTLERYSGTFSCFLPAYNELEKQVNRFLKDKETAPALDFMTRQPYRAPGYLFDDYVADSTSDSLLDSSALAPRLGEIERFGVEP